MIPEYMVQAEVVAGRLATLIAADVPNASSKVQDLLLLAGEDGDEFAIALMMQIYRSLS